VAALADEASRGMSNYAEVLVVHRAQDLLRLPRTRQIEPMVHGAHDEVSRGRIVSGRSSAPSSRYRPRCP
jgi:hypothetical protein